MEQFKRLRFRKWFVVINNPDDDCEDRLKAMVDGEIFRSIKGQREIGKECETEHLQVQVYGKRMTYKKMIKIIHDEFGKGHIEHVRNEKACDKYTTKDETCIEGSKFEYGDQPRQGRRTDLEKLRSFIRDGATLNEVKDKDFSLYARYKNVLRDEITEVSESNIKKGILQSYEDVEWKDWQSTVIEKCGQKSDRRKVHWYWESSGNVGKSFLSRYLCAKHDVYYVTGGKSQDILYGYNNQSIIVYDLPRVCEEHMQAVYSTIECFKNGMFLSTKYETKQRIFNVPHVFVFANYEPEYSMLSEDRWDVVNVDRSTTYGNNSSTSLDVEKKKKSDEHLASIFKAYDGKLPSLREARGAASNSSVERWRNNRDVV